MKNKKSPLLCSIRLNSHCLAKDLKLTQRDGATQDRAEVALCSQASPGHQGWCWLAAVSDAIGARWSSLNPWSSVLALSPPCVLGSYFAIWEEFMLTIFFTSLKKFFFAWRNLKHTESERWQGKVQVSCGILCSCDDNTFETLDVEIYTRAIKSEHIVAEFQKFAQGFLSKTIPWDMQG